MNIFIALEFLVILTMIYAVILFATNYIYKKSKKDRKKKYSVVTPIMIINMTAVVATFPFIKGAINGYIGSNYRSDDIKQIEVEVNKAVQKYENLDDIAASIEQIKCPPGSGIIAIDVDEASLMKECKFVAVKVDYDGLAPSRTIICEKPTYEGGTKE